MELNTLVVRAKAGDLEAFGRIVGATQTMAFAVALGVLRDPALAQDAVQDAYVIAFRRLADLDEPAAFLSWFRRVVVTVAINARRARRHELIACGVFTDRIVAHIGGDPAVHTAVGAGYGLERLAMLRYGIDDIRKMDVSNVA